MWGDPNLATAMVAFATLLLAFVAAMSIDATRAQDKRRRKEALLNEIIEWAMDAAKCEAPIGATATVAITDAQADRRVVSSHLSELASICSDVILRGQYISQIASNSKFGKDLQQVIAKLIGDLEARITLLGRCNNALRATMPNEFNDAQIKAREHWLQQVRESIHKVIEEATKIKTKDIGRY